MDKGGSCGGCADAPAVRSTSVSAMSVDVCDGKLYQDNPCLSGEGIESAQFDEAFATLETLHNFWPLFLEHAQQKDSSTIPESHPKQPS